MARSRDYGWRVTVTRMVPKPVVRRVCHGTNTVNWGRILKALFDTVAAGGTANVTLKDDSGVNRTGIYKLGSTGSTTPYIIWIVSGGAPDNVSLGVWSRLGTGTTPAARTDYTLQTPVGGYFGLASNYADGDAVTLTGTVEFDSPVSPSEAGLFIDMAPVYYIGVAKYMLDRAVFTPLPSGTSFTVTWTIQLG